MPAPATLIKTFRTTTVVIILSLITGCGLIAANSGPEPGAEAETTFWHGFTGGSEAAGVKSLVDAYQQQQSQSVRQRPISNEELFTVLRTGLAGSAPPDLVQFEGYQQTRDFAAAGQLTDLSDLWAEHQGEMLLPDSAERACSYQGKIYCIPYSFASGSQIYYNADLLAEHGIEPPVDYRQFLAAAEKLKQAGVPPIAIGAKDGWPAEHWWMLFLVQRCGVDTVQQAGAGSGAEFTDDCFVRAAEDLADLARRDYFTAGAASDDYGTALSVFRSGQAAFFQTGSWFAGGLATEPTTFRTGILPFPRLAEDQHPGDIVGAVTHVFGIPAKAKNAAGARRLLEYLISEEGTNTWAKAGNLALRNGAVESQADGTMKSLWTTVLAADASLPWLENELPPGVGEDKIYNGTAAIVAGRMTPEEFVASVQQALEQADR